MNTNLKAINRGKIHGLACLLLVIPYLLLKGLGSLYPSSLAIGVGVLVVEIGIYVTYAFFLLGILALARERADEKFQANIQYLLWLYAVMCLIMLTSALFFNPNAPVVILATSLLLYLTFIGFGFLSLRVSKDFARLIDEYGEPARKAAKWNKIVGYLMVSVVLTLIGAVLSLVADYYMWRVLQKHTRSEID